MSYMDVPMALYQLSDYLYRYYGKKVIILLDEYDTPMQEAYVDGYWDEMAAFTRSFFNATFKSNPWSILHFLNKGKVADYWVNTSSNALVSKLIQE